MRHLVLLVAVASACGSTPNPQTRRASSDADARAFAVRLIDVLERDDVDGWRDMLSARMQRRTDADEGRRLFATWREILLPYVQSLRSADWTLAYNNAQLETIVRYRTVGTEPMRLVRVVDERGALRIDEN